MVISLPPPARRLRSRTRAGDRTKEALFGVDRYVAYLRTQRGLAANSIAVYTPCALVAHRSRPGERCQVLRWAVLRWAFAGRGFAGPGQHSGASLLFSDDAHERDAHGMAVTRWGRYSGVADRDGDVIEVIDTGRGRGWPPSTWRAPSATTRHPTCSTSRRRATACSSPRGGLPLSSDPHASTDSTPGPDGDQAARRRPQRRRGEDRTDHQRDARGVERADAHGIRCG